MTNRAKLILLALLILASTMIDPLPAGGHPIYAFCAEYGFDSSDSDLEACAELFGWPILSDHHADRSEPPNEDEPGWQCQTMGNLVCGPGHGPYAHQNEYMVFLPNNRGVIR